MAVDTDQKRVMAEQLAEEKRKAGVFHRVFDSDDGHDVLEWFSDKCLENERTFVPGSPDVTAFNEGKRCIILMIRRILGAKFQ